MSRGSGYPEENIKTSICILRLTHFPMGCNLALAAFSSRKVPNLDISRPHSLSAKNRTVQSESRTRSALRPWQHNANASLAGSDDTISSRYGCELKPDGALRAMLRQCNACRTTLRSDTDAVGLGFCFVLSLVPCAVVSFTSSAAGLFFCSECRRKRVHAYLQRLMESKATAMADGLGELVVADVACSIRHDVEGFLDPPTSFLATEIGPTKASVVISDAHSHMNVLILKRIIILFMPLREALKAIMHDIDHDQKGPLAIITAGPAGERLGLLVLPCSA